MRKIKERKEENIRTENGKTKGREREKLKEKEKGKKKKGSMKQRKK